MPSTPPAVARIAVARVCVITLSVDVSPTPPDGASDVDVEVDDDGDDDDVARRLSHIKLWFCNPTTVEGCECFAEHVNDRHSDAHGEGDD